MAESARARRSLRRAVEAVEIPSPVEVIGDETATAIPRRAVDAIRRMMDKGRALREGSRR